MSEWLVVTILGLIEGITEFLPVSSTGHLLLAEHWLPEQSDLFNVVIQSGAVLAVIMVFQRRLVHLFQTWREPASRDYVLKLALAFFLTGVGGLAIKKLGFRLPHDPVPVALATLIGGVLFILVEWWLRRHQPGEEVTWAAAAWMGVGQLLAAVFPGTSRSGVTILIGLGLGLSRPVATEFSFLLGVPTLVAAGGLETFHALRHPAEESPHWGMILLASLMAAITAFLVVKWLLRFVQTHTFVGFGWYRIGLGLLVLFLAR